MIAIKNLAVFERRMQLIGERLDQGVGEILATTGEMAYVEIVTATPVDTGTARTSWNLSIGQLDTYVPPYENYPSMQGGNARPNALRIAAQTLRPLTQPGANVYTSVFVSSSLDYIGFLNQGSSQQAPADFVLRAVMTTVQAIRSGMFQKRLTELA
jgi:hypothetical protein